MKIVTILMFIATSLILGQESQTFQVSKSQSVQSSLNRPTLIGMIGSTLIFHKFMNNSG